MSNRLYVHYNKTAKKYAGLNRGFCFDRIAADVLKNDASVLFYMRCIMFVLTLVLSHQYGMNAA